MRGLYARERQAVSSLAHLRFFPQAVTGGQGSFLFADDGRTLIDFAASWGAISLGHSHPRLCGAVDGALGNQAGASYLSTANEPAVRLAEKLLSMVPQRAAGRVWLGHSGSDANETVARLVLAATGRSRILSFEGAYHGGTTGSIAVSGHPVQAASSRAPGLVLVPFPQGYGETALAEAGNRVIAHIEALFAGTVDPQDVAAFFIEPIQSDGGMLVPPPNFLSRLEAICRRHGILLVCDEVKVGLGRTGTRHAFEAAGIEPDIIVFGKGLGCGLPVSAVVGPEDVMNHATAFSFQTTHGNPVCAAAGLAVLETIEAEDLVGNAARCGAVFRQGLDGLADRHDAIRDVRGRGLALGLEIRAAGGLSAKMVTALTAYRAFELGLVIYYVGVNSNVLEFTPPLTLSPSEAIAGLEILDRALEEVVQGKVPPDSIGDFAGW